MMKEFNDTKVPIYVAVLLAILLITAAGYYVLSTGDANHNAQSNQITSYGKDTIKLYKNEGYEQVYYDSEFEVYCWKIGEGLSCKTMSELRK